MSLPEVFRRITTALDQAGIAYMLTGSFARAHDGAPRSTEDIDLIIAPSAVQLRTFIQGLSVDPYYAGPGGGARSLPPGVLVPRG